MLYSKINSKNIHIRLIFFALFVLFFFKGSAQFIDNFSDGDLLNNPKWEGNVDHFTVNTAYELQLNATVAGESYIYSGYKIPRDSVEIDLYFKMTFDPSDNNFSRIYLAMDNPVVSLAKGFYLQLGENGTTDNIKLYKFEPGLTTLLASGSMGAISKDPALARVKIRINQDGLWVFETNYSGEPLLSNDFEVVDNGLSSMPEEVFFGILCKYTSTRLKNFFFDNISIQKWIPDTTPPTLTSTKVLDSTHIELIFNEKMDMTSTLQTSAYLVSPSLGIPSTVQFGSGDNIVVLTFDKSIQSGIEYTLQVTNVQDLSGNVSSATATFAYAVQPKALDLVLSEILTDPIVGGEDFIEVYNRSQKFIQLQGLILRNHSKNEEKILSKDFILKPDQYLAISKNIVFLIEQYKTPVEAQFLQNDVPTLNVSDAHIQIINRESGIDVVIDQFTYVEDYHYSLLNDTKGVSLEKIRLDGKSEDINNWHSASQEVNFGTPGYKNSNFSDNSGDRDKAISIENKIFSPYSSDYTSFLLIDYKVEKSGYLATVQIFDTEGFLVRSLTKNLLLGLVGSMKWDGINDEGQVVKMGWYVIATQLLHPDGETKTYRHSVVVGDKL
ncbi:MAG: Ig-like domain-containing protein [Saprospiraceae bacterium]